MDIRAKLDRLGNYIAPTDSDFHVDGRMNQVYSQLSTTHGHITDCKLVCMCSTRLVLVRPAASLYDFHIEQIESLDQFDALEEKLSDSRENQRQMVTVILLNIFHQI